MVSKYGKDFIEGIVSFDNFGYTMIDEATNVFEGYEFVTRLYKLND